MRRIIGIDLPEDKRVETGLTYIYGLGRKNVLEVLKTAKVDAGKKIGKLTDEELSRITKALDSFLVEGDLRKKISEDIQRLKSISCYRGYRHNAGLPVRGQRTRSNARTKRGKRRTIGAMKKDNLTRMRTGEKQEE